MVNKMFEVIKCSSHMCHSN